MIRDFGLDWSLEKLDILTKLGEDFFQKLYASANRFKSRPLLIWPVETHQDRIRTERRVLYTLLLT